jgi:hypothetical protein
MSGTHRGKALLAIGVVAAITIGGLNYFSYRYWERQIQAVVEQEAMVLARTIEAGIMVVMLEKAPKKIEDLLDFATEAPDVDYVRVMDNSGTIAFSTISGEEGTPARPELEPLLKSTAASVDLKPADELGGSVTIFLPIMNRDQCHACHDPGLLTNGALDMRLAMGNALKPMAANRRHMITFSAAGIAALFGALYVIFRIGRGA